MMSTLAILVQVGEILAWILRSYSVVWVELWHLCICKCFGQMSEFDLAIIAAEAALVVMRLVQLYTLVRCT